MKWTSYRKWKNRAVFPLATPGWILMITAPELSARWFVGLGVLVTLGVVYVAEELVWMLKGRGRPCAHCGGKVEMRSFRVLADCPHCRLPLE